MANAAQTPKLQLGKLSPEDAERLASTFRPIWDLDDAPFAQGSSLSAADVDALAAGAGVASSVRGTQQHQNVVAVEAKPVAPSNPGHVPALDAPKVEIAVDLDPADLVSATPPPAAQPVVAQASAQAPAARAAETARKPYTPPRPPPEPVNMRDATGTGDFVPVKKSNTGLIIAGVAVVAIVGAVIGVKVMGGDKNASASKTSTSQTTGHEETTHIPPPPEVAATQEQAQTAQPTQPPPPATVAKTNDSPIVKEFPTTTAPTHTNTATASNVTAPVHTATHSSGGGGGGVATTHGTGGGTKPGGGKPAIVRDNPF